MSPMFTTRFNQKFLVSLPIKLAKQSRVNHEPIFRPHQVGFRGLSVATTGDRERQSSERPPWLWRRFHGMFDFDVPMTEPLPGIAVPKAAEPLSRSGGCQITSLANGVRVVTPAGAKPQTRSANDLVASVGLYLDAGSRYETPETSGATHLMESLAFRTSTLERSAFRLARDIEKTGGSVGCAASRESIAYSGECMKEAVPAVLEILAEVACKPRFMAYGEGDVATDDDIRADLKETQDVVGMELQDIVSKDSQTQILEALHATAFEGNTLGLPLLMNERRLKCITPDTLKKYLRGRVAIPSNLVVSAVGARHDELVSMTDHFLGWLPADKRHGANARERSHYTGGEARLSGDGLAQVVLACKGVSWTDSDLVPVCVLHTLMGGGGSFSAGGPGKGMYSRLYTSVLNHHPWVHSCTGFNHCYTDAGLFGIHAMAEPDHLPELTEVVCNEISKMGQVTKTELSRAKNQTKGSLLMNLENPSILCEDLGRQVLTSGKYIEPLTLYHAIEKVTDSDITRVAERFLQSKPAVVLYGEMYGAPSFEEITSAAGMKSILLNPST